MGHTLYYLDIIKQHTKTRAMKVQIKQQVKDIIQSKVMEESHYLVIADFTNWIIFSQMCHGGDLTIKNILNAKGFGVCKKSQADHYSLVEFQGKQKTYWLKKKA